MVCAVALVAALFSGFCRPLAVKAASSKTVRVTTQKELNTALKDASVETIILRSETYDSITISSKKAKKKNIIIDAENSNIVNKSRFKSIELISAAYYIEDVSNNTITASTTAFEIAEGRTVKKLTLTVMSSKYVIRKGASIKNLAYNLGGNKSKYNKSTRTLKVKGESFDWQTYDYVTINYTLCKL